MIDHIGLAGSDLARSRAFYAAALEPLGLRSHYGPGYYAALVLDTDGINLEAVFREEAA